MSTALAVQADHAPKKVLADGREPRERRQRATKARPGEPPRDARWAEFRWDAGWPSAKHPGWRTAAAGAREVYLARKQLR